MKHIIIVSMFWVILNMLNLSYADKIRYLGETGTIEMEGEIISKTDDFIVLRTDKGDTILNMSMVLHIEEDKESQKHTEPIQKDDISSADFEGKFQGEADADKDMTMNILLGSGEGCLGGGVGGLLLGWLPGLWTTGIGYFIEPNLSTNAYEKIKDKSFEYKMSYTQSYKSAYKNRVLIHRGIGCCGGYLVGGGIAFILNLAALTSTK